MKRYFPLLLCVLFLAQAWSGCGTRNSNNPNPPGDYVLSYGDSILFMQPSASDYIVYPTSRRDGVYSGFPEGIEIDASTGAINVSKSETGLRYLITHTATDGKVTTTKVVLSGITFTDHYYHLSTGDSTALPVYNADKNRVLPVSGSVFDDGNGANSGGCSVRTDNGKINLAACVRNGIFGSTPQNNVRKDFDIYYRLNDGSGKSLNKLRVRLYYYQTQADVTADLIQTLQDRENDGVFLGNTAVNPGGFNPATGRVGQKAKPRPPCVIIVAD